MNIENINVSSINKIISPIELKEKYKVDIETQKNIIKWRQEIENIIKGKENRLIVIIGPCSIHDIDEALYYANQLVFLRNHFIDKLFIIMRVYFEKPRTTIGWKGLINDPDLDGTFNINKGFDLARKLLLDINKLGLPVGCEFLDVFNPQYYSDLVSYGAIGARTVESQIHRELASGLSMPIGFKNGTNGNFDVAIDAVICANNSHIFIGIDENGNSAIVKTKGNNSSHIILRGGKSNINYDHVSIDLLVKLLNNKSINNKFIIDCSHDNSGKNYKNQELVLNSVMDQIKNGQDKICGVMIESNINEGSQKHTIENGKSNLLYGTSITDSCVDLITSFNMLNNIFDTK